MWNLLKKKLRPQVNDAAAERLANKVLRYQREVARRLNRIAVGLNARTLNFLMISVGLAFASYCIYLILR